MKTTDDPIIVEQNFNNSHEEIWNAITNPEEMIKWYFDNIPAFKAEVGFFTEFNVKSEERNFLHKWKVTEVIANEKNVYNWTYENYKGSADMYFEIFKNGDSTKLQIKVIVLEDFNNDIPEFKRESCIAGWEYFIKEQLKGYLEEKYD